MLPDDADQKLLEAVRDPKHRGLSLRALVVELAPKGFATREGTALQLTQIAKLYKLVA